MKKLKSSIKSIQESISSLNPINHICLQEASTQSFRENIHLCNITNQTQNSSSSSANNLMTSQRFFFSPCKTRDIMEEFKSERTTKLSISDESITMAMDSFNPFQDFRESMKEMVEANRIREWAKLQELLHCYLRLNEKKNHKIIVLAFVDLLMHMMSRDKEGFYASFPLSFYLEIL